MYTGSPQFKPSFCNREPLGGEEYWYFSWLSVTRYHFLYLSFWTFLSCFLSKSILIHVSFVNKKQNHWKDVALLIQWNPSLRPPRYYGHFILARKKLSQSFSYLKNPFNTTIPLIRPVFHGPKVVVLTGFHCTAVYGQKKNYRVGKRKEVKYSSILSRPLLHKNTLKMHRTVTNVFQMKWIQSIKNVSQNQRDSLQEKNFV